MSLKPGTKTLVFVPGCLFSVSLSSFGLHITTYPVRQKRISGGTIGSPGTPKTAPKFKKYFFRLSVWDVEKQ